MGRGGGGGHSGGGGGFSGGSHFGGGGSFGGSSHSSGSSFGGSGHSGGFGGGSSNFGGSHGPSGFGGNHGPSGGPGMGHGPMGGPDRGPGMGHSPMGGPAVRPAVHIQRRHYPLFSYNWLWYHMGRSDAQRQAAAANQDGTAKDKAQVEKEEKASIKKKSRFWKIVLGIIIAMLVISVLNAYSMQPSFVTYTTKLENSTGSIEYIDADGCLFADGEEDVIYEGLKYFNKKTNIFPVVYVTYDTSYLEYENADAYFSENCTEDSFLLIYVCNQNADEDDSYYYIVGNNAYEVIDDTVAAMFETNLEYYYSDLSLSNAEFISETFKETADDIITRYDNATTVSGQGFKIFLIVVLGGVLIYLIIADKKLEKAKLDEEILNTPLEKFSDSEAEDLAKKYESKSGLSEESRDDEKEWF